MDTRLRLIFLCSILCLVSMGEAALAAPSHYTATNLGALPFPQLKNSGTQTQDTNAYGINDKGQVVGGSNGDAFLWDKGKMMALGLYEYPTDEREDPITVTAMAISNKGFIVGYSNSHQPRGGVGGIAYDKGKQLNLDLGEYACAVNNRDEIVGSTGFRGFYCSATGSYRLDTLSKRPENNGSIAVAINDKGQFVGATTVDAPKDKDLPLHAFLWVGSKKSGKMKDLGTLPRFPYSIATAINNRSEVAGYAGQYGSGLYGIVQGVTQSFVWRKGKMIALVLLAGTNSSRVNGINNNGLIVGTSGEGATFWASGRSYNVPNSGGGDNRATLWTGGKAYDLNALLETPVSPPLTEATGINNHGQIICNSGSGAYLLTPIQENRVGPVPGAD